MTLLRLTETSRNTSPAPIARTGSGGGAPASSRAGAYGVAASD